MNRHRLGLARQSTNTAVKLITPVVGLLMAMSMHAIWNGSGTVGGCLGFIITYAFVMVPAFIVILVVIIFGLRREGRIVREFLNLKFNAECCAHKSTSSFAVSLGGWVDRLTP